jgi:AraC-like DNA-binding protein
MTFCINPTYSGLEETDISENVQRICTVRDELAGHVQAITLMRGAIRPRILLPDGTTSLVFGVAREGPKILLHGVGTRSRALSKSFPKGLLGIAVHFRPGRSRPFLNVPMSSVRDQHFALADLWGRDARDLCERLGNTGSASKLVDEKLIDELQAALIRRLKRSAGVSDRVCRLVNTALPLLSSPARPPHIERVAVDLGVSGRQLQRAFDELVGLSPKTYAQVIRFQRAIGIAGRSTHPNWAQVALDAGYYDQAHMIAAFHRFAAATPASMFMTVGEAGAPASPLVAPAVPR